MKKVLWVGLPLVGFGVSFVTMPACSSSSSSSSAASTTAAAVAGSVDAHCQGKVVTVDPSVCHVAPAPADGGDEGGAGDDGGGGGADNDFGATMFNAEGDDDDCKYHVKWTSTAVAQKQNVTFTVIATNKKDNSPLTGSPIRIEGTLDNTKAIDNTDPQLAEPTPGTYTIGPIVFGSPGEWVVRFHFHEECDDSESSPHGHAAFYVQVP